MSRIIWHNKISLPTLLLLSCCCIPLQGLYDDRIAPKWYLSVLVAAIIVCICAVRSVMGKTAVTAKKNTLAVAAAVVIAYNIVCVAVYDFILPAEVALHLPVRGTFDNPTGYALSLCILIPLAMLYAAELGNKTRVAVMAMCIIASITVVLSYNRCGMLFLVVYWTTFFLRRLRCAAWIRYLTLSGIIIIGICFVLSIKQGSTSGRRFILERTWELIQQKPLTGYGWHGLEREYMPHQADFFKAHPDDGAAWLADDIVHPFNEFLYVWMNFGLTGMLALVAVFAIPVMIYLKTKNRILGMYLTPMAAVSLFALVSYPHLYPMAWLAVMLPYGCITQKLLKKKHVASSAIVICLLIMALAIREMAYENRWHRANEGVRFGYAGQALERYELLYPHYRHDTRFLYSMMFCQYQARQFGEAAATYERMTRLCRTYDMELLMGDILRNDEQPRQALHHYNQAHHMVPVRFAPLAGMMKAYTMMGDTLKADSVARVIISKKVKVPSVEVQDPESKEGYLMQF